MCNCAAEGESLSSNLPHRRSDRKPAKSPLLKNSAHFAFDFRAMARKWRGSLPAQISIRNASAKGFVGSPSQSADPCMWPPKNIKFWAPIEIFPLPGGRRWVSGGVNSACAARRLACEAFAQEPIHHQLGLNLKLGWCGVHDCTGRRSLLARNPAENFGRDWWVVDVAIDQGAIRHDLFPKRSGLLRRSRSKVLQAGGLHNWIKGHCS